MDKTNNINMWLSASGQHYQRIPPGNPVALAFYCLARAVVLILLDISAKMEK